jgi:hypothetical protein
MVGVCPPRSSESLLASVELEGRAPLARKASMLNWAFFLYLEARSAPNLISSFAWTISWGSRFKIRKERMKNWDRPRGIGSALERCRYIWSEFISICMDILGHSTGGVDVRRSLRSAGGGLPASRCGGSPSDCGGRKSRTRVCRRRGRELLSPGLTAGEGIMYWDFEGRTEKRRCPRQSARPSRKCKDQLARSAAITPIPFSPAAQSGWPEKEGTRVRDISSRGCSHLGFLHVPRALPCPLVLLCLPPTQPSPPTPSGSWSPPPDSR